ncbi:YhgE/Pip family protein [Microbacterium sp. SS28]|uniref:YhgE/Pip family protein n=1 Tax=Microbacterium sp. SS28 TaxID=2919948 RepID=UPI001FA98C65|nr:YhgE/Pip family protein [Microbacterium sp. SS28]
MSLPIERARSRKPVTWLTLTGVLLLPVVIGGVLVASLYNPAERLDEINAAIVNEDEPVTIDDQLIPLGRQLTAGLVEGSDELDSNLTWTLSNPEDAAAGIADGTYDAVITIPENFSAAATSTRPGETPEQATIEVQTAPDALIVDNAITAQVTQAAASLMGEQLSQVYLENVFLGFTTLGDQLGTAATGARELADGAQKASDGAAQLPGGVTQIADGAGSLSSGATSLAGGLDQIAAGIGGAAGGARDLAAGVSAGAATLEQNGLVPDPVLGYAATAAASSVTTAQKAGQTYGTLAQLAATCDPAVSTQATCDAIAGARDQAKAASDAATTSATDAGYANGALLAFDSAATTEFVNQFTEIAGGATGLASGLDQLQSGTTQSAAGARQLASGAAQLSDGGDQLATGTQSLADGVAQLASGTDQLATGLQTATDAIPTYTDTEAASLADVVSNPVTAEGNSTGLFGESAIPLLATIALWFGGLATFVALQAVSRRSLASRAPSAVLALRAFGPAAGIGALQGLLVAGVVQLAASYDWSEWSLFAGLCIAAGVAFAAVNQALVAVFGGAGRWISALIGAFALATGIVSTVPPLLASISALLPTAPAYNGMMGALTPADGVGAGLVGLAIWGVLAFVATILAVARRRTISARTLLAASGAPATSAPATA